MKSKLSIFSVTVTVALLISTFHLHSQGFAKLKSGTTNDLLGVSAPSYQICYVTGAKGTILKTIDGGGSWVKQTSGLQPINGVLPTLYSTWFTSTTTGYAVGDNGAALKTTNGGSTWSPMVISPSSVHLRSIRFANKAGLENIGYATGGTPDAAKGYVYRTTDGGASWKIVLETTSKGAIYSTFIILPATGTTYQSLWIYCVGYDGSVYSSNDGGDYWANPGGVTQTGSESYYISSSKGFVGAADGSIYKTESYGKIYEPITPTASYGLRGVDFTYGNLIGYFVGGNVSANTGTILNTKDGGTTWNLMTLPAGTKRLWGVDFVNSCNGFVTGLNGTILKFGTAIVTPQPIGTCAGNPISITAAGAPSYTWALATGLDKTTGATVTANPATTTTYTISGNDNGCVSKISVKVEVLNCEKSLTETSTSIDEAGISNAGQISPNPTSGVVNIYPIAGNELTTISIMDALGRTVYESKVFDNNSPVEIDLSKQPSGIYFVRLVNGSNLLNKKIIKQ